MGDEQDSTFPCIVNRGVDVALNTRQDKGEAPLHPSLEYLVKGVRITTSMGALDLCTHLVKEHTSQF